MVLVSPYPYGIKTITKTSTKITVGETEISSIKIRVNTD